MSNKEIIQQVIVVRKDLIELTESELNELSIEKRNLYFKELEIQGKMNRGKLAAQVSHASMGVILKLMRNNLSLIDYIPPETDYDLTLHIQKNTDLCYWLENEFRKVILYCKNQEALKKLIFDLTQHNIIHCEIKDKGYTAFNGQETLTCVGIEPLKKSIIDKFTKKFQILK